MPSRTMHGVLGIARTQGLVCAGQRLELRERGAGEDRDQQRVGPQPGVAQRRDRSPGLRRLHAEDDDARGLARGQRRRSRPECRARARRSRRCCADRAVPQACSRCSAPGVEEAFENRLSHDAGADDAERASGLEQRRVRVRGHGRGSPLIPSRPSADCDADVRFGCAPGARHPEAAPECAAVHAASSFASKARTLHRVASAVMALYLDASLRRTAVPDVAAPRTYIRSREFDSTLLLAPIVAGLAAALVVTADPRLYPFLLVADLWLLGYHHVVATYTRLAFDTQSLRRNRVARRGPARRRHAGHARRGDDRRGVGHRVRVPLPAVVPLHAAGLRHRAHVLPGHARRTDRPARATWPPTSPSISCRSTASPRARPRWATSSSGCR